MTVAEPGPQQPIGMDKGLSRYFDLLKRALSGSIYEESAWAILEPDNRPGLRGRIRTAILRAFQRRGLMVVRKQAYDDRRRELGQDWPMVGLTMVGHKRLENIRSCIETVIADNIPGDFVECGVWRGGASIYAKALFDALGASDRKVWLADSFEGMPIRKTEEDRLDLDLSWLKYLAVTQDQVAANFRRFAALDDNVRFIKGWFSESLTGAPIDTIAVLRLDGDYYTSTMAPLTSLYRKVSPGGFVIIDDYNVFAGCRRAVTEFRAAHGISAELVPIDDYAVYWRVGGL